MATVLRLGLLKTLLAFASFLFDCAAQPTLAFTKIAEGLTYPVDVKNAGDFTQRLFIVEETGTIKIYRNNQVLSKPFLDVTNIIQFTDYYNGLFSISFAPNYQSSGYFFICYTQKGTLNLTLARYRVSTANADSADPNSGVILLSIPKPARFCDMHFGNDNYLYITINDGKSGGDRQNRAQDSKTLINKMLRLDVNVTRSPYYKIPPDNPFVNDPDVLGEIWALGLRNAWRWSFDRQTGDLWIPDVGEYEREEINFRTPDQSPASNYGWRCYEGNLEFNTAGCEAKSNYVFPVFDYPHNVSDGGNCIIGGYVYRGSAFPELNGYYICVDFTSRNIWKIKTDGLGGWDIYLQKNSPPFLETFGEGEDGELYAATRNGTLYHIITTGTFTKSIPGKSNFSQTTETFVYPTLVYNSHITIVLKDRYKFIRILDITGHEILKRNITSASAKMSLQLPQLNTGTYIVQLIGNKITGQKIYVTK